MLLNLNQRHNLLCLVIASGGLRFEEVTALLRRDFVSIERGGAKAYKIPVTKAVGRVGSGPYPERPIHMACCLSVSSFATEGKGLRFQPIG